MGHSYSLERKKVLPTEFLCAIVHELKAPVAAVLGLADLLKYELQAMKINHDQCSEYIEDLTLVASEMNELVNDILDVQSGALSGNFTVDLSKETDLGNVIKRAVKLNYGYALKRKIAITTEIAANIRPIKLDAKRLKQILTNLLSNAIKYSPKDSAVKITAAAIFQDEAGFLQICVIDQGFGMTKDQIATAFEKYQTIENPNSGKVDSFGLGLPIVRQLIELQNGKIEVQSQLNKGTEIKLTFPYAKSHL